MGQTMSSLKMGRFGVFSTPNGTPPPTTLGKHPKPTEPSAEFSGRCDAGWITSPCSAAAIYIRPQCVRLHAKEHVRSARASLVPNGT